MVKKIKLLNVDDITTWNGRHNTLNESSFSIEKLNEGNLTEDEAVNLETFINDYPNDYFADQFNIEYMGIITGIVNCGKEELVQLINEYLKEIKKT